MGPISPFREDLQLSPASLGSAPSGVLAKTAEQLGRGLWDQAVRTAIGAGFTDVNGLTDTLFYLLYPDLRGKGKLPRGFASKWTAIRDRWVKPALSGGGAPVSGSSAKQGPGAPRPILLPPQPRKPRPLEPSEWRLPPQPEWLLNWPKALPIAPRDAKTAIGVAPDSFSPIVPPVPLPTLTEKQRRIVERIRANREALPEYAFRKTTYKGGKGYVLGDSGAEEKLTPRELQGGSGDTETRAKKFVWKELGREGRLDSINTYDDQIVTWGKGFSARSGYMNEVLQIMFQSDPAARELMLGAGIDCERDRKSWKVVNGATGAIETGENALRLMRFDTKLLGVFVTLGRDPRHRQHALDAQWQAMSRPGGAAAVPSYAWNWPEPAIALTAHLSHWTPAFGWRSNDYSGTGGDLVKIVGRWARAAKRYRRWAATLPNGAIVGPADMMRPGHRLFAFASGAAARAVEMLPSVKGTPALLGADPAYAGHVLLPKHGESGTYYDLGMAGL